MSLALSFASAAVVESASSFERWLAGSDLGSAAGGMALRLGEFRELREAVVAVLEGVAAGSAPPPTAVERINDTGALVPFAPRLETVDGRPVAIDEPSVGDRANDVLAAIARSAIRLAGSSEAARLRRCPACRGFFLASRPDRIWCGASCGNRVRVARHHARRRAG
jgi:predicted RNA-binding Zn ribbon-like protein